MTDQEKYWQKFDETFFNDGNQLCDFHLSLGFNQKNLFDAQRRLYQLIDELNISFLNRAERDGNPTECRKGCAFCCHQTVLAAPYELFYLADFVKKKFRVDALEVIKERATSKKMHSAKLKIKDLLNYKQICPLLHPTEGYCRAYQARPMACRIYLSYSVKSCQEDLKHPEDESIFPKLYEMPLRAGRMMNEGFQARIRKGREEQIQAFENTIEEGLLSALPDDAFEKWMNGKSVFRKI